MWHFAVTYSRNGIQICASSALEMSLWSYGLSLILWPVCQGHCENWVGNWQFQRETLLVPMHWCITSLLRVLSRQPWAMEKSTPTRPEVFGKEIETGEKRSNYFFSLKFFLVFWSPPNFIPIGCSLYRVRKKLKLVWSKQSWKSYSCFIEHVLNC